MVEISGTGIGTESMSAQKGMDRTEEEEESAPLVGLEAREHDADCAPSTGLPPRPLPPPLPRLLPRPKWLAPLTMAGATATAAAAATSGEGNTHISEPEPDRPLIVACCSNCECD